MLGLCSGYALCFRSLFSPKTTNFRLKLKYHLQKKWIHGTERSLPCEESPEVNQEYTTFLDVLKLRRAEAKRSILVQVQSSKSFKELYNYCSTIGTVKEMFHYKVGIEPLHFIIVEFKDEPDLKNVLSSSSHVDDSQIIPVHSSFLWFRACNKKVQKQTQINFTLRAENGTDSSKDIDINEALRKATNVSDQMRVLHNLTKLNEVGTRLRFLTAKQVEECLTGMFPNASALPFGSSVNGCGKMGCDLDLVLRLSDTTKTSAEPSRLMFHCKATTGSERSTSQRHMEAIGDLLQLFLPGCAQVRRILQARVPIIKYRQQLTDIECDLSMGNMSGVHMSDFLHLMGSLDERVWPLIFTVKKWACEVGLTNSSPGRWVTNFSLTLLVLAFLQKPLGSPAVLPPLDALTKGARPEDRYVTEDGIDCSFVRDKTRLTFVTQNNDELSDLLKQFFEFYSQFDFAEKAVSLNEGKSIRKPEHSPLYIVNPLEKGLNVGKNVSVEEIQRFKEESRNAAWLLEADENNLGILGLFSNKRNVKFPVSYIGVGKSGRLMDVTDIFHDEKGELSNVENKVKTDERNDVRTVRRKQKR